MSLRFKSLSATGSTRGTAYTMSNKVLTHEGKTHVVWLDQIRNIYVRTFHHQARRWSKPVFVGEGDDNHAGAALAMDSEGFLHLVFGPHHNPIQHAISTRPNTSTSWVMQPVFGGTAATYPSLVCDAEDTLHVCYRGAFADERPRSLMYQRRPKGGPWSDPVQLVNPEGPLAYTQFENALYVGRDGTLFLSYHIVRASEADHKQICGRGFGVMVSRDGGIHWQTVDGEALLLPTTPDSPCVIEFDETLDVRMGNVVCDDLGHSFFTLNRREGDFWQTFLYRWRRNQWDVVPLLPEVERVFGECEMSDVCALSISEDGVMYAAGVVCPRGGGWAASGNEIVLFTSRDGGDTFSTYLASPEDPGASNWLPSVERCTGHNRVDVPGLVYTHGEKGEGCSPDVDTEIRFVSLEPVVRDEVAEVARAIGGVERLSGFSFTEEQREKVRRRVEGYRKNYQALREVEVGYDVEPPTAFLPGVAPGGEARAFRLCDGDSVDRPTSDEELAFLPVTKLARLIESRVVSPVELTRLYLDRLQAYGPGLHCVVTVTEDLALKQARVAEAEILQGRYRGPLHGIPWGAKDLLAVRGFPTTWGATPFRAQILDMDATVVERLHEAGAVLVGKLSLGALAMGPHWFGGMTRNPWDPEKDSSGSSAGPGAATAAGLVGFSIGSETLGSIVSPSHRCGVTGLRPTYGRVSRYGAMALSWTMDKLGPMCRGVEDCAAVLDAIYGADGKDRSVGEATFCWEPELSMDSLRIGYVASEFEAVASPEDRAVDEAALSVFRSLGAVVEPVDLPDCPYEAVRLVLSVEAAAAFDDLTRSGGLDVMTEEDRSGWPDVFRGARMVPAVEYLRAQRVRTLAMREMEALMDRWDVILTPGIGGRSLTASNLTGHPALTLPCGFVSGMPRGLTLIGNLYDEAKVLAVGRAYEQATDWHERYPDLSVLDV